MKLDQGLVELPYNINLSNKVKDLTIQTIRMLDMISDEESDHLKDLLHVSIYRKSWFTRKWEKLLSKNKNEKDEYVVKVLFDGLPLMKERK